MIIFILVEFIQRVISGTNCSLGWFRIARGAKLAFFFLSFFLLLMIASAERDSVATIVSQRSVLSLVFTTHPKIDGN